MKLQGETAGEGNMGQATAHRFDLAREIGGRSASCDVTSLADLTALAASALAWTGRVYP